MAFVQMSELECQPQESDYETWERWADSPEDEDDSLGKEATNMGRNYTGSAIHKASERERWADCHEDEDHSLGKEPTDMGLSHIGSAIHDALCCAVPFVVPFVVQWHWAGSASRTYTFSHDANAELEQSYQLWQSQGRAGKDMLQLRAGSCSYNIDFEHMTQENVSTGRRRDLSREVYIAQWHWANADGSRWYLFDDEANSWIEQLYQRWQFYDEDPQGMLLINECMYDIDLESMKQRNQVTDRERRIDRKLKRYDAEVADASCTASMSSTHGHAVMSKSAFEELILKVELGGDRRRLLFKWDTNSKCEDALMHMRQVILTGFGLETNPVVSFRYRDDDGDLCTLVPETFRDCLSFARCGVLNLIVEKNESHALARKYSPADLPGLATSSLCAAIPIASLPTIPRKEDAGEIQALPIDEEYDSTWSMIELPTDSTK